MALIPQTNSLEHYLGVSCDRMRGRTAQAWKMVYESGFQGCFVDAPGAPGWAAKLAQSARAKFHANCRHSGFADDFVSSEYQGAGAGKRMCGWNYYLQIDREWGEGRALRGSQDYGNCTAWMAREMVGVCYGIDIVARGELHRYYARPGTAVIYGSRGWSSQGMALSTAMETIHNDGIQLETLYCDNKYDLRNEQDDESYGNRWGRSGPPKCILEEIKGDRMDYVGQVSGGIDAVKDLLYAGYAIATGSTLTGRGPADPVCRGLKSIGGHAQACIGYDDTDECRDYLKSVGRDIGSDCVIFMDQSWGPNWISLSNWNEQLWGEAPEGVWPITGSDFLRIYNQWKDVWAINNVLGFPLRKLPDWGSSAYL